MVLDVKTLILLNVIINFTNFLVLLSLWQQNKKKIQGIAFLTLDMFFQAAGFLLILFWGFTPDVLSIFIAYVFIAVGPILVLTGMQKIFEIEKSQRLNSFFMLIFVLGLAYFSLIDANLKVREIGISLIIIIISIQTFYHLYYKVDSELSQFAKLLSTIFVLYTVVSIARMAFLMKLPSEVGNHFLASPANSVPIIVYMVLNILITASCILIINKRLLIEVKSQEKKYISLFYSSPYAVIITSLIDGSILEVNDRFVSIFGYKVEEVIGKTTLALDLWNSQGERNEKINKISEFKNIKGLEIEVKKKDGQYMTGLISTEIVFINDRKCILTCISDINEISLMKKKLHHMAFYDTLTGLPNRSLFSDRLDKQIQVSKRTEMLIGVIFIDLDSFKEINDTMGHESGDEVLKEIAKRLVTLLRKQDTVARFGGDEFLIMITNILQKKDLENIVSQIMKLFKEPITVKGQEFFVTASAGISIYPLDGDEPEILIKNADMVMYLSKKQGKNTSSFCTAELKEDVMLKMKLTNSLYRAQERNELEVFWQPQICVPTNKIIGLEALIRWNHPELGIIMPANFICLAEQTGIILQIGEWVLRTACKQSMAWQSLGIPPVRIAVNLSAEQFRQADLVKTVQSALMESGLPAELLELEITESVAIKSSSNIIPTLIELKKLGVSISIDDFGMEYSSLNRLKMMPVDRIKMDMCFVNSISKSSKDDSIVKVIIQLAKNLDIKVIAEGVETKSQLDFLVKEVCDEVQGNYFYGAMQSNEIELLLKNQ